jgi:hypothetical protein
VNAGVNQREIGPSILKPWVENVAEWMTCDIDPERINPPPRLDKCLTER